MRRAAGIGGMLDPPGKLRRPRLLPHAGVRALQAELPQLPLVALRLRNDKRAAAQIRRLIQILFHFFGQGDLHGNGSLKTLL